MGYGVNGAGKDAVRVLRTSLRSPPVPGGEGDVQPIGRTNSTKLCRRNDGVKAA